jgi:NCAIR mutase (PurE)-related protein
MSLAKFATNSILVTRASDLAKVSDAPFTDWEQQTSSKVIILPDDTTPDQIARIVALLTTGTIDNVPPPQ